MSEWGVFLTIGAMISFVAAVVAPMIKLTKSITTLTVVVDGLQKAVADQRLDNRSSHDKIWQQLHENEATINDHESRIGILEHNRKGA